MIRNSSERKLNTETAKGKPLVTVENCYRPALGRMCVNSQRDICRQKKNDNYELARDSSARKERKQTRSGEWRKRRFLGKRETSRSLNYH